MFDDGVVLAFTFTDSFWFNAVETEVYAMATLIMAVLFYLGLRWESDMNKPLAGIRVIDLTHMLSGPYCAMILADLGAETIKVEPLKGEGTRKLLASDPKNSLNGMGANFG